VAGGGRAHAGAEAPMELEFHEPAPGPPVPEPAAPPPAKDPMSIQKLLKRFGIK